MSDPKPTSREVHLAVEFVKSCPPNTGRPAALAHAFAEYRAELARDPAFILPAAEAMLREAGATTLELLYWDRGASDCLALRDRHHKREAHAPAGGLADAVSRLATSRKSAGEEGG
jgi:hypothetical protein